MKKKNPKFINYPKMFRRCPKSYRTELLMKNEIPTLSEVKHFLGENLAQVVCEFSHPDIKQFLGITPQLQGTDKELWISPSDQLIGKVCLKPPLTNKCIKACTHNGILQLGEQAKQRWEMETAKKLRDELEYNMKDIRLMFEAEKRHAINLAISHTKKLYEIHLNNLAKEHEQELEYSVTRVLRNANKKVQGIRLRERLDVTREMMTKLKNEISYVVNHLCEEFNRESLAQKDIMVSEFNRIIRHERAMADSKLKACDQKRAEDLQQLRIELDAEFDAKRADITGAERMKIKAKEHGLHQCAQKKIEVLEDLLLEAKYVIELLGQMQKKPRSHDNFAWREKMCEILSQFEKFLTLAFEVVPGQADLITALKSLVCDEVDGKHTRKRENGMEITASKQRLKPVSRSLMQNEKFQVVEIIDKHGEKWRPIQLLPDVPQLYCTEEQLLSPIVKSEIHICQDKDYIDKDSLSLRSTVTSDESLPFVSFNNKMYVRCDYRPDTEESSAEMKTMTELAENSRFVLGLNDPRPCNILIKDIRDDPSSSTHNDKQKRSMDDNEYSEDEFEVRVQNLINAIERVENESSIVGRKSNRCNDDKVVRDLINHLRVVKNSKGIPEQSSTAFKVKENPVIEETRKQSARSRVKSLIKIFRVHPCLQSILIQAANDTPVNKQMNKSIKK